jgi:hypothetical protein
MESGHERWESEGFWKEAVIAPFEILGTKITRHKSEQVEIRTRHLFNISPKSYRNINSSLSLSHTHLDGVSSTVAMFPKQQGACRPKPVSA